MLDIERMHGAIREEGLSGWLFYNMFHRDAIADLVLQVPAERSNTRPWVWLFLLDRPPVKIVHQIEASVLSHLPGETILYYTREEFARALTRVIPRAGKLAADFSTGIPVSSFLDHGTASFIQSLGVSLASAESLVAAYLGTVDERGRFSQESSGKVLHAAVKDAWSRLAEAMRAGRTVREGDLRDWIAGSIASAGLVNEGPPITGAGRHTNDPHFTVEGRGEVVKRGDVIQFDLWGRAKEEDAIYADISWLGVCAPAPTADQKKVFDAVVAAREAALSFLREGLARGDALSGAAVDRAARAVLVERGFAANIRHRTGHSIGSRVHGFGVNLDSVEFPDERLLREGACFSIEPGVYREEFGMRTEIDCCIHDGRPVVTGGERQTGLLVLE
jgi:Xaa-Pro dipeptidase